MLGAIYPLSGPQAASSRAEELKTVYWETGAVADPITAHRHYVFRTVATGSSLGRMAVTFSHDVLVPDYKLTTPRAVVVRVNDIYGQSVGGGEQDLAQAMGINVVDVVEYNPNAYDANVIALRVAQDRPDFLWDVNRRLCRRQARQRDCSRGPLAGRPGIACAGQGGLWRADGDSRRGWICGGWTLFHDVLPNAGGSLSAESIRVAALKVDVAVGDSINGGGVKFAGAGALDEGQNTRAAAVVGQWQAVGVMKVVYPPAYRD